MTTARRKSNHMLPWRFAMFFALLALASAALLTQTAIARSLLVGFDVAAVAFLAACTPTLGYAAKQLRAAAAANDANRVVLLIVSFVLSLVILAAIAGELSEGSLSIWDKALVAISLILVWLFGNAVYTLHYAHLFYTADDGGKDCAGLKFPNTPEPLMADFAYFAFTLGVAVQTSDVIITSPHIRKVATIHCVAGFFFNLGVLALTINILGSR